MQNLRSWSVIVVALFSFSSFGQQMALMNAPEPAAASASSSSTLASGDPPLAGMTGSSASAILPVGRRPALDQRVGLAPADWVLLGAGAALRLLDYKSTVKAMSDPADFREDELPNALVHCRPGLGAFEAGTVVVNYYAYRLFVEHRHRRMARWGQIANLAALGWTVGRNYYELNEYWPHPASLKEELLPRTGSLPAAALQGRSAKQLTGVRSCCSGSSR
jgi:hypothetical protein